MGYMAMVINGITYLWMVINDIYIYVYLVVISIGKTSSIIYEICRHFVSYVEWY